ncbi:hypothetical protein I4U23_005382 [Adineta vaga]|nr:hypothetical protein I4U23_005382 [Adineta vaga]
MQILTLIGYVSTTILMPSAHFGQLAIPMITVICSYKYEVFPLDLIGLSGGKLFSFGRQTCIGMGCSYNGINVPIEQQFNKFGTFLILAFLLSVTMIATLILAIIHTFQLAILIKKYRQKHMI